MSDIGLGDALGTEIDVKTAIGGGRAEGRRIAREGSGKSAIAVVEGYSAALLDLAYVVIGAIGDGRQGLSEGAGAGPIAADGDGHIEGFVGTLVVVDVTPAIEGILTCGQI